MRTRTLAALAMTALIAAPAVAQMGYGSWHVDDRTSPVTGRRSVLIATQSKYVRAPYGGPASFLLGFRCVPSTRNATQYRLEAFVLLDKHRAASRGCISYKIDNDAPVDVCDAGIADNDEAYFFNHPDKLAKALLGKQALLVEIPTANDGRVVTMFKVGGLEQHLPKLGPQCEVLPR